MYSRRLICSRPAATFNSLILAAFRLLTSILFRLPQPTSAKVSVNASTRPKPSPSLRLTLILPNHVFIEKIPAVVRSERAGRFFLYGHCRISFFCYRPSSSLLEFDLDPNSISAKTTSVHLESKNPLIHLVQVGFPASTNVSAQTSSPIRLLRLPSPPSWAKMSDFPPPSIQNSPRRRLAMPS